MKRLMLTNKVQRTVFNAGDIPEEIAAYISELKLLYYVPLSYLIPDEALLSPESVRFFCIDDNYARALTDGALSIGRNDSNSALLDGQLFSPVLDSARGTIRKIRQRKVHKNHQNHQDAMIFAQQNDCRSGFFMRSALAVKHKGLEFEGYFEDTRLELLRCELIMPDILICIFDGMLTRVIISEPKTCLRFGAYENSRKISVKSIKEDADFGRFIPGKNVRLSCDEKSGRLDIVSIIKDIQGALEQDITPSVFAFEMMLAAQQAVFYAGKTTGGKK